MKPGMKKLSLLLCSIFLFTSITSSVFAAEPTPDVPAPPDTQQSQETEIPEVPETDVTEAPETEIPETEIPEAEIPATDILPQEAVAVLNEKPALRREISADNPLFVYNIYTETNPDIIDLFWGALPDDLKPYFAVQIVAEKSDSPEHRARIKVMLDHAQALGVPIFIQTESMNTDSNIPQSFYASLFDEYSVMTGLVFAELSASGLTIFPITAAQIQNIKDTIDTVSSKGGYFMWQDMGYENEHLFVKSGADQGIYNKITQNKENVILVDKHNGRSKRFVGPSAAMGFWASDLVGNWGPNSEDWLWWEAGFSRLYEPAGANRSGDDWKCVFTYPDAQFGIDWLIDMAAGATVYSLECPYHGFTSMEGDILSPAFENVLVPIIRKMINESIIPTREQVLEKTKVAHQVNSANPKEVQNDELFVSLYGPEGKPLSEWTPSTGRYAQLPIIPKLAGQETLDLYNGITTTEGYNGLFPSHYDKQKRFNQDYPAIGSGDSWFMSYENNHFIANPNENKNITTGFEFPLTTNPKASLAGSISPHTLSIVQERSDGLDIHLSNYRIDSNADVWDNPNFSSDDISGYVRGKYIASPSDSALRQSIVIVKGISAQEPVIEVTGGNGYTYTSVWNDALKELKITVNHNGAVDINLQSDMELNGTTDRNLAIYGHISSSSCYDDKNYTDEKVIDGVPSTRWNASASNKSDAWLELNFDTAVTVNKLVLKEFENRVSSYKFQYWNGTSWQDIFTDTTIGENKVKTFDPVTAARYRAYFTSVSGDEASIYEMELYNTASPTLIPTAGENLASGKSYSASSVYENDPDRAPEKAFDQTSMTSWNAGKGTTSGEWLEVDFGTDTTFNKVISKAMLDRITGYKLQYWDGTVWQDILSGTRVYPQVCDTFTPVTSQKLRIYITSSKKDQMNWGSDVELEEFGVYNDGNIPVAYSIS